VRDKDGKSYKTVVIGTQTWMAENLAVAFYNSRCYGEVQANCAKYGMLYDWSTAMDLNPSCNTTSRYCEVRSNHQGICPDNWHIPNVLDWNKLLHYVDGTTYNPNPDPFHEDYYESETAGIYLKAASGWDDGEGGDGSGVDKFGFAALPGGSGYGSDDEDGHTSYNTHYDFYSGGASGLWWSNGYYNNPGNRDRDYYYRMNGYDDYWTKGSAYPGMDYKSSVFSVRCVKN